MTNIIRIRGYLQLKVDGLVLNSTSSVSSFGAKLSNSPTSQGLAISNDLLLEVECNKSRKLLLLFKLVATTKFS